MRPVLVTFVIFMIFCIEISIAMSDGPSDKKPKKIIKQKHLLGGYETITYDPAISEREKRLDEEDRQEIRSRPIRPSLHLFGPGSLNDPRNSQDFYTRHPYVDPQRPIVQDTFVVQPHSNQHPQNRPQHPPQHPPQYPPQDPPHFPPQCPPHYGGPHGASGSGHQ